MMAEEFYFHSNDGESASARIILQLLQQRQEQQENSQKGKKQKKSKHNERF